MKKESIVLNVENLNVITEAGGYDILTGTSFRFKKNEITAIVGESGSGKSTVINAILGLLPDGLVMKEGKIGLQKDEFVWELDTMSSEERRSVLGKHIGYVPQDCLQGLDPNRSIGKFLSQSAACHIKQSKEMTLSMIEQAANNAGLPENFIRSNFRKRAGNLSGGERQRVLIANAILHTPEIVLYDEPTTALDAMAKKHVLDAIRANAQNSAALVVSHDLEAMRHYADYIYVLYRGGVVEEGVTAVVMNTPVHPYTRDLLATIPQVSLKTQPRPIAGKQPSVGETSLGCKYYQRCSIRQDVCCSIEPVLVATSLSQKVSCHVQM